MSEPQVQPLERPCYRCGHTELNPDPACACCNSGHDPTPANRREVPDVAQPHRP